MRSGLPVFEGHGVVVHGLADVPEVDFHRLADVHALQPGAQLVGQNAGVVPVRSVVPKAGHGNGQNVPVIPAQQVEGDGGNENGQRGVRPPLSPTTAVLALVCFRRLASPWAESRRISSHRSARSPWSAGHEGVWVDVAGERRLLFLQLKIDRIDLGGGGNVFMRWRSCPAFPGRSR